MVSTKMEGESMASSRSSLLERGDEVERVPVIFFGHFVTLKKRAGIK